MSRLARSPLASPRAPADPLPPMSTPGAIVIGGDHQGLGIVRSLGRRGIPSCVVDDESSIARASRYTRHHLRVSSLRTPGSTVAALTAARRRFDIEGWVVFPTRDETVEALAREGATLAGLRIPTPGIATIRSVWDKRETYRIAGQLGIPIPRTWFPRDDEDLKTIASPGPFVVKPAIKEHFFYSTHAKAWRANGTAELKDRFHQAAAIVGTGEVIVQELIPGENRSQFAFCTFFKNGRSIASMTVRRRRQHPSDFGRASTFVETVTLPELEEWSNQFLTNLGFYGLAELEFARDPRDGAFKLLDVNARTWGYHTLGQAAGVDFPYLLYRDQMGQSVGEVRARPGVRWIRLATDVPNALRDMRAANFGWASTRGRSEASTSNRCTRGTISSPSAYEMALLPYLALKRGL